jgi:aspartate carbamoyltransferase catalytic subunit
MTRHLLSIHDLSRDELLRLTAPRFGDLDGLPQFRGTLAFLFLQPSLRTMGSFANAGALLGLAPVPIRTTGDTFRDQVDIEDEIEQLGLNSRCVVARTGVPLPAHRFAAMHTPLVNAGDGTNEHPTQALIDLTALRQFGLEGKRVVMMGNVRDYRVHHSLVNGLVNLGLSSVELLCPPQMPMEAPYLPEGVTCTAASCDEEADEVLSRADFVYMTPTQHFNLPNLSFGERFSLNLERAHRVLKPQAKVLHPFPRLKELAFDLDNTSFDGYHPQAALGTPVRQRLLAWLLSA